MGNSGLRPEDEEWLDTMLDIFGCGEEMEDVLTMPKGYRSVDGDD